MKHSNLCALALAASLCAATSANAANLLVNGGFETGDFTGWTVVANATGVVTTGYDGFTPHSGTYFAALGDTAGAYPYGTISQEVIDTPGQALTLDYFLASDGAQPNYFDATFNGVTIPGSVVTSPVRTDYIEYTFTLLSTGDDTLLFHEQDVPAYWAFDDVSLTYATSTVPLPGSAPMLGAALLALSAVGYGMKRKKATVTA